MIIKLATNSDLIEIEKLQRETHASNLDDGEKEEEGFVSLKTSLDVLHKVLLSIGIICAINKGQLIGYEIPLPFEIADSMQFLKPFTDRVKNISYHGIKLSAKNTIIEGQICIRKGYKGMGLAEQLHRKFLKLVGESFDYIVTEISDENPRSLHVHTTKLGFEIVEKYSVGGRDWFILAQKIS